MREKERERRGGEGERKRVGVCTGQHCTNISVGNRKKTGPGGRGREGGWGVQGSIAPIYQ